MKASAVGKKFQAIKQWLLFDLQINSLTLSLSIICCGLSVDTSPLSVSTLLSELVTVVLESVVGFSESTPRKCKITHFSFVMYSPHCTTNISLRADVVACSQNYFFFIWQFDSMQEQEQEQECKNECQAHNLVLAVNSKQFIIHYILHAKRK